MALLTPMRAASTGCSSVMESGPRRVATSTRRATRKWSRCSKNFAQLIVENIPTDLGDRRVRVMALDEARLGSIGRHRRRYRHRGERPRGWWGAGMSGRGSTQRSSQIPGGDLCRYLSALDGVRFEVSLQRLGERFCGGVIGSVLDNAPAHRWQDARIPGERTSGAVAALRSGAESGGAAVLGVPPGAREPAVRFD